MSLKNISLLGLGTLYLHTQKEQASKMLNGAYSISFESGDHLACYLASNLLKGT